MSSLSMLSQQPAHGRRMREKEGGNRNAIGQLRECKEGMGQTQVPLGGKTGSTWLSGLQTHESLSTCPHLFFVLILRPHTVAGL